MVKAIKYQFLLAGLLLIIIFTSCERVVLPNPDHEGVRYELQGELNGAPFYMGIGSPEMEMIPHHNLNQHDVWEMSGTLRSKHINKLPNFRLTLRNYSQSRIAHGDQTEVISGPHDVFHSDGVSKLMFPLRLQVLNHAGFSIDTFKINQDKVYSGSQETTLHFDQTDDYHLTLLYSYQETEGCYVTTHIAKGMADTLTVANWHIANQYQGEATLKAHVNTGNISDFQSIRWSTGESSYDITVQEPGWYAVSITNTNNQTFVHHKFLHKDSQNAFSTYSNDLGIASGWQDPEMVMDLIQTGAIDLEYQDENGVSYRPISVDGEMPKVTISKINLPRHHPNGTLSFDIEVHFSITMESEDGEQINFRDVQGVIAIGVPE